MYHNNFKQFLATCQALAAVLLFITIFAGCTRTIYVPLETKINTTDTVTHIRTTLHTDTIRELTQLRIERLDSVVPILDSLERVVGYDRWHIRTEYHNNDRETSRLRQQLDSLQSLRHSQVYVSQPIVNGNPSQKRTSLFVKLLSWFGAILLSTIGIYIYLKRIRHS